ncbi:glutathione S-transferase N-terminal domain-containing protein [Bradyrhizobium sp. STM 3557]|uniref:glutathione S-transferase N-terminal domain-containing protein n=1 Tax=Bradyrhizobium sp. STM 3557 TaxID=578920 RepID=UPI00388D7986
MKFYSFWRSLASFRVRIALHLKNAAHEVVLVDIDRDEQRSADYASVNPQMVLPALVLDDGTVLSQSLAILDYLDETFPEPPLLPADIKGRARVRALALMVACEGHPLLVPRVRHYLDDVLKLDQEAQAAWRKHWIVETLKTLEAQLAGAQGHRALLLWRCADDGRYLHGRPCFDCAHAEYRSGALPHHQAYLRDVDGTAGLRAGAPAGAARYAAGDAAEVTARPPG